MIQIDEWMAVAVAFILLLLGAVYLLYFKITKKLFPKVTNFQSEIKSREGSTVCEIEGSGIIKTIEVNTNGNCIINMTIDGFSRTVLRVHPEFKQDNKSNRDALSIREQFDEKFAKSFTIHVQNEGDAVLQSYGTISFETHKEFKTTLRTIFNEL